MNKTAAQILKAGLLVGTLDILAAFLYFFIQTGNDKVSIVLKYIASGVFGKSAMSGGVDMIIAGLVFHYIIAFAFTLVFFWLFPKIKIARQHTVLTGILYGAFIWAVMNLVVVPLSGIGSRPFNWENALINLLILIVCMGIPLSLMALAFYNRKSVTTLRY
ncbi:MAG TPA: hypothetical protein VEX63_10925 [Flavisolibacter sp.]|nr:hypothetical protein [Flavisolibacter sp.]